MIGKRKEESRLIPRFVVWATRWKGPPFSNIKKNRFGRRRAYCTNNKS